MITRASSLWRVFECRRDDGYAIHRGPRRQNESAQPNAFTKRLAAGDFRTCLAKQHINDSPLHDMDKHLWYVLFRGFFRNSSSSQTGSRRHFVCLPNQTHKYPPVCSPPPLTKMNRFYYSKSVEPCFGRINHGNSLQ